MKKKSVFRLYAVLAGTLLSLAAPAQAQFQPRPISEGDPAPGEIYHVEASGGFWGPTADMSILSQSLTNLVDASLIDFKTDLGLTDQRFREVHLVLRPARKHKFRFQYIPIRFSQSATINRDIIFNGQRFQASVPVNSTLDWKAYRFGYEFDFLTKDTWYVGFVLDFKQTDITATLTTPIVEEFSRFAAPIPAIGGAFRVYVIPSVSISGEVTAFKLPNDVIKNTDARYIDVDFYGTFNFNRYIGAQLGYRSLDLGYTDTDFIGNLRLKGFYFGAVARY